MNAGSSCLLGSINISEFVINPFTEFADFDYPNFEKTVRTCIRALNVVLEEGKSLHPLKYQQQAVDDWKFIGLGTFGVADALIKMGLKYANDSASLLILSLIYENLAELLFRNRSN